MFPVDVFEYFSSHLKLCWLCYEQLKLVFDRYGQTTSELNGWPQGFNGRNIFAVPISETFLENKINISRLKVIKYHVGEQYRLEDVLMM